ncbi:glycosyl transferase [Pueribacillus theae]|uniref:Glycosyl transferase n=1 Tax=Pueribacillus theae TaxID=2171751 RepID=A0A2U1JKT1_9BACI|nr:glycosyltransferase [Pueribacillus theae]PWA05760.1 glycosyl transferase [Pueribacillus theae]
MKICFMAAASSIHTVRWANALAERGHEVHLITMHRVELNQIDGRVKLHCLKIPAPVGYYANRFEAKLLIRKLNPDVLHVHYASGYGTLARLVQYHPTLLSVWGSDVFLFPYESRRNERIVRKNLLHADHLTSTSDALRIQTERFIAPKKQIDVIPFGIDLDLFKASRSARRRDTICIGTVKGLKPVYGIDLLLKAIAQLIARLRERDAALADKLHIMIVGGGPQLSELQQLAKDLHISSITEFVGAVPNEQVPYYLNQLDIYCALSRSESFGVAVLEASACEVPVVVSNVGGLPEVVEDGKTGFVVSHEKPGDIVDKLLHLVIDHDLRREFGKCGRRFVRENYAWDAIVPKLESVYFNM